MGKLLISHRYKARVILGQLFSPLTICLFPELLPLNLSPKPTRIESARLGLRLGYRIGFKERTLLRQAFRGKQKMGKLLISHRYNRLPLLHSWPGGVQRELVV